MLETLVSSRIRRALFEHILTHPSERFYLRGLAKSLSLSVSPLRRELKRLECSGVIRADQEGNILFYTVNTTAPFFLQLQQANRTTETPSPVITALSTQHTAHGEGVAFQDIQPIPIGVISAGRRSAAWQRPLRGPALLAVTGVGLALMVLVAGLAYLTVTHQRFLAQFSRALAMRKAEVTVVVPPSSSSSATMRGSRWQVVPGGVGGFNSGSAQESY